MDFTRIFLEFLKYRLGCSFYLAVECSLQISPVLLYRKIATFDGFSRSIFFCCNSVKYEANFIVIFLLLSEMIKALKLLQQAA